MRFFKAVFDFYLDASLHVALAVVSLYLVTTFDLNKSVNFYLVGFLIFSTVVCYNFMKYGVEAEKYLIVLKSYHKIIQVFSFLCFPIAVFCFFKLDSILWFPIALFTIITGLYILPFLPHSKNLRTWGGFKIYLVALVWVGFTVVLPVLEHEIELDWSLIALMVKRFILVIILFIPFEIRDLKVDKPELKTLPQRIGIDNTKKVGFGLVVIYFLMSILLDYSIVNWVVELIFFAVLWTALALTFKNQPKYFASFWVEGIPIVLFATKYFFGGMMS